MIFIGELINGTRKTIGEAILNRDVDFIQNVAVAQTNAGADYLDVNAGTSPNREAEDMLWLIDVIQQVSDTPICIDSSSATVLEAALDKVVAVPLVNSVNADPARLQAFLPIIAERACPVIALAMDDSVSGMPKTIEERKTNINKVMAAIKAQGIPNSQVFIDPLIMAIATDNEAGLEVLGIIEWIKQTYPEAHITGGFSNISFGLPERTVINRTFLALAIMAGADSAVINPTNTAIIETVRAAEMLLGRDRFCRKYTKAAKAGFTCK